MAKTDELLNVDLDELTEAFEYLDELRESGVTNMFGAGSYLTREFGFPQPQAHAVLSGWMKTFDGSPAYDRAAVALAKAVAA